MKSFTNNELPDMTDAYRQMYEGKKKDEDKKDEKSDRWQDDDADGKWYEKSDVDGKISKREKEEAKKNKAKKEGVELEGEQLDEISADLALKASKKADIARGKAAHAGDKETAVKKNQQAQRLYAKQAAKRKNESVIKSKKEMVLEDIVRRVYENMKGNSPALNQFKEDYHRGQGEKIQKRTKKWMDKTGQEGAPGLDAMKSRTAEHKSKRGVKEDYVFEESYDELDNDLLLFVESSLGNFEENEILDMMESMYHRRNPGKKHPSESGSSKVTPRPVSDKEKKSTDKEDRMYVAMRRVKGRQKNYSKDKSDAADKLHGHYTSRQAARKKGASAKEAAAGSHGDFGSKGFRIKRGGRSGEAPRTDRGTGNKAARRAGQEVRDTRKKK